MTHATTARLARAAVLGAALVVALVASRGHADPASDPSRAVIEALDAVPVPAALLAGGALVDKKNGFRLAAPGKGWRWLVARKSRLKTYLCHQPTSGQLMLVRLAGGLSRANEATMERFFSGMRQGAENKGGKLEGLKWEKRKTPHGLQAVTITFTLVIPNTPPLPNRQVAIFAHESFIFAGPVGDEDGQAVQRFVDGLQLTAPSMPPIVTGTVGALLMLIPLGLFFFLALFFTTRLARQRLRGAGWVLLIACFGVYVAWRLTLAGSPSAYEAGRISGEGLGILLGVGLAYFFATRWSLQSAQRAQQGRLAGPQ